MKNGIKARSTLAQFFNVKSLILVLLVTTMLLPACTGPSIETDTGPSPEASFEVNTASGQAPFNVEFFNKSKNADHFQWDFGDGTTTTSSTVGEKVTHQYTKTGTYTVTLSAIKEGDGQETSTSGLTITVNPGALDKVSIPQTIETSAGATQQLTADITDQFDNQVTEVDVSWSATNQEVVTITQTGLLVASSTVGTFDDIVSVEVTQGGLTRTTTASVIIRPGPIDQMTVDLDSIEIGMGMTHRFITAATDQYGNVIPDLDSVWTVQNGAGTIDNSGLFTAGTTPGTYNDAIKVEATHEDTTASITIDVTVLSNETWKRMVSGTTGTLQGVWGNSPSDVYAVGDESTVLHYNGTSWRLMDTPAEVSLQGIWGSSSSDIFAVGLDGAILHYDGEDWSQMDSGTTSSLEAVWGTSSSDVFAAGEGGTILHYDGDDWSIMDVNQTEAFHDIWGSSPSDVIAGGDGASRKIWHYDGIDWGRAIIDINAGRIFGIWGTSPSDAFAVGYAGIIWHYGGASWSLMTNYLVNPRETLHSIWGESPLNVLTVGESGTILHYGGGAWNLMASGTDGTLWDVWVSSQGDAFIVGQSGTILYYDIKS
ncbi:MAG: PKD domain-containing protein [Dehalococcoidales bacterium]|nr:MAG: PKD domain-containing protein [Dehalococcoidales bacterium]